MTETIKYKGVEYPFKVGYYALKHTSRELKAATGKEIELEKLLSGEMENYEPLLWHSLVMGHKLEDKDLTLKREDMEFVLDECLWEFIGKVPNFFQQVGSLNHLPNMTVVTKEEEKNVVQP